jgi:hypothetical protein
MSVVLFCPAQVRLEPVHPGVPRATASEQPVTASSDGSTCNRLGRHCASRVRTTSPARSSTLRCCEIAGRDTANGCASSLTVASPAASRASMARRVGSAKAAKVSVSRSCTSVDISPL